MEHFRFRNTCSVLWCAVVCCACARGHPRSWNLDTAVAVALAPPVANNTPHHHHHHHHHQRLKPEA